ncbi:uncharacterized protein LOC111397657 [Olea europaea var. sylvestris]|uniref:uncharacterized protein LOC111397657 n=1 Tax=Olea europaea var. sylvestris TaxID=158386 RepID=UPI000C1D0F96|nr:uncharacterized protein LOC111397657 [Olea europaea var. sylvestris]
MKGEKPQAYLDFIEKAPLRTMLLNQLPSYLCPIAQVANKSWQAKHNHYLSSMDAQDASLMAAIYNARATICSIKAARETKQERFASENANKSCKRNQAGKVCK